MDKIKEKLRKIKALAEEGTEGEKVSAIKMYEKMKLKYGLEDIEIIEEKTTCEWFRYKDELEKRLLSQIFYMITGSDTIWVKTDKRYKLIGIECTEFEKDEIKFYFEYYKECLLKEFEHFISAFCCANNLFPTEEARCYTKPKKHTKNFEGNDEMKIGFMVAGMDVNPRPLKRLK